MFSPQEMFQVKFYIIWLALMLESSYSCTFWKPIEIEVDVRKIKYILL